MTRTRGNTERLAALLLAVALLMGASACGSRSDDAGDDSDDLSEQPAENGGGGDDVIAPDSATVGTIDNPCSGEVAEGDIPADTPGVTEDQIRIGVISDKANSSVPLPTVGIEEGIKAFVAFCNEAGGINGRNLELVTYDSQILQTDDVTRQACADDLFALVGSGSVQDQLGVETRVECGLPEVAAYSATSSRAESDLFFQPIPATQSKFFNTGPCEWIVEQHPEAVKKAAIVYTDLPAARTRGEQIRDNCTEAGIEYVVDAAVPFGESNFGPLVSQMKDAGVTYFTMVSAAADTLTILNEAETQGVDIQVLDLGQQYYDRTVAEDAISEGAYVLTNTVPFSETDDNPVLRLYTHWVDEIGADEGKITTLGVQAFSAGLLFATAVDGLGSDLTREALLEELSGITSWDGGGLQMTTNPGENKLNNCFLYMRVVDGEFVREYPEADFDCDPAYVQESEKAYVG